MISVVDLSSWASRIRISESLVRIHVSGSIPKCHGSTTLLVMYFSCTLLAIRDGKLLLARSGGGHRAGDVREAGGGRPSHHLTLQGQGRHSSQVC
ncbi:MAG: hypothetical protein ACK56I_04965 [bacterium]